MKKMYDTESFDKLTAMIKTTVEHHLRINPEGKHLIMRVDDNIYNEFSQLGLLSYRYKKVNVVIQPSSMNLIDILKRYVRIVNGQPVFKNISYKKNIKDFNRIKEFINGQD